MIEEKHTSFYVIAGKLFLIQQECSFAFAGHTYYQSLENVLEHWDAQPLIENWKVKEYESRTS
ncbi:hypothetical protein DP117_05960 [Brasilonema sp. UFV-L1]|nr:hypothetical protein [Brasilonema sp. UFV-L1]